MLITNNMKNKSVGSGIKIPLSVVLSFIRNKIKASFEEQKKKYFPVIVSVHVGLVF
jgi:F0F1-type ATP synthase membrane subunit a